MSKVTFDKNTGAVTDWLGNVINIGDYFINPQRQSSSIWLALYKLVGWEEDDPYAFNSNGWRVKLVAQKIAETSYGNSVGKNSRLTAIDKITKVDYTP